MVLVLCCVLSVTVKQCYFVEYRGVLDNPIRRHSDTSKLERLVGWKPDVRLIIGLSGL